MSHYKKCEAQVASRGRAHRNLGYHLNPLLSGKIQCTQMKKEYNISQVGNLLYGKNTNWTSLIALIKTDNNDIKLFTPHTDYSLIKWNETNFESED